MNRRLYAIPTNRDCAATVTSLIPEVLSVSDDNTFLVCVSDSSPVDQQKRNERSLRESYAALPVRAMHVTKQRWDEHLQEITADLRLASGPSVPELFLGADSYGRAINRLLLTGVAWDAVTVHRRDSDVYIPEASSSYPIGIECRYLGQSVGTALKDGAKDEVGASSNSDAPVWLAGGGYVGDSPVDYDDLATNAPRDVLVRLAQLPIASRPRLSEEEARALIEARFDQGRSTATHPLRLPAQPEVVGGNMAVHSALFQLPVSTAQATSAVDYFPHGVLKSQGLPCLQHDRALRHEYAPDRREGDYNISYYRGIALGHCEGVIYSAIYSKLATTSVLQGKCWVHDLIADTMLSALCNEVLTEAQEVLRETASAFAASGLAKYREVADRLEADAKRLFEQVELDVKNHAELVRIWPRICGRFAESRPRLLEQQA